MNPVYAGILRFWNSGEITPLMTTLITCTDCRGSGLHTYLDPSTGHYKTSVCQTCEGSGQNDNGDGQ